MILFTNLRPIVNALTRYLNLFTTHDLLNDIFFIRFTLMNEASANKTPHQDRLKSLQLVIDPKSILDTIYKYAHRRQIAKKTKRLL